jgi:hypothetical protein
MCRLAPLATVKGVANRNASHPTARRFTRQATLAIIACLALFGATGGAGNAAARSHPVLPPQGLYEGCAPGTALDTCIDRLAQIRAAGFHYVLNYSAWYGSPGEVSAYADAAQSLGVKLIWPLNHVAWHSPVALDQTYSSLAEGQGPLTNPQFISFAIGLVRDHPATWGFYIGDEVVPEQAAAVEALSMTVRTLAPHKPQLYVARPGALALKPFLGIPDIVGVDVYPIGSSDPPVWRAAHQTQILATRAGEGMAVVLQAFSWSQYDAARFAPAFPTRAQMRRMRDSALRSSHPQMILWYSFQDIQRSDSPTGHWKDLAWAAFSPPKPDRDG